MQLSQRPRFVLGISSLLALAVVASIVIVVFPYWRPDYWRNKSALEERLKTAAAQGTPVRFSDLAVSDPAGIELAKQLSKELKKVVPIPNELLEPAYNSDSQMQMMTSSEENPQTAEPAPVVSSSPKLSKAQKNSLRKYIERNEAIVARIDALKPLSACRFIYDTETPSPMGILLPHIDGLNQLLPIYRAKFILAAEDQDAQAAFESTIDILESSECLAKDSFLVCQLVRIRTGEEALENLLQVMQMTNLSEEQFLATDALLRKVESEFRLKDCLISEAAMCFTSLENIAHPLNRENLLSMVDLHVDGTISRIAHSRVNRWTSLAYQPHVMAQQLWLLNNTGELAKLVDEPGPEATASWTKATQSTSEYIDQNREEAIASFYPAVESLRRYAFRYRHQLLLSRIALRLDRYYAQEGYFPNDLTQVIDNTLPTLPNNLWTDEAVQYKCEEGKCELSYNYFNGQEIDTVSITLTK